MDFQKQLTAFIYNAKKESFASDKKPITTKDNGKVYHYKQGPFLYRDKYYGNIIDGGQEIVFFEDKPIWTMCYRGGMISNTHNSSNCFLFLKKSLLILDPDCPIRGPNKYKEGNYTYHNIVNGELSEFTGTEVIQFFGLEIYLRRYLGGVLKKK